MPAKKHNFTVVEIKAGLMVIASGTILGLFVAVMTGLRPPAERLTLYASFSDTAGLNQGADVRFGGTKVGRVVHVALDPDDQSRIRVQASLDPGTPVNAASVASIGQTTLTAEKHLEISTGEKGAERVPEGAEIPSGGGGLFDQATMLAMEVSEALKDVRALLGVPEAREKEAKGEGAFTSIADILEGVDSTLEGAPALVEDAKRILNDSGEQVSGILERLKGIEDSAQELLGDIQDIVAENREDIRGSFEGVRGMVDNLRPIVQRVAEVTEELDGMADTIQAVLDNAEGMTDELKDAIAANRPLLDDLLLDLRETVQNLKAFARVVAEQPEAVLRGRTPGGRR
ncbi:MAG TPA: MCE family protein [Candidatus Hydrogenedentes bacterium]|nr:MCE family protein [Candidatus Hydrogenedentota bacterium]